MLRTRRDSEILKWWWSIDGIAFIMILAVISIGALLIATATPAVADRIGAESFYFMHRQFVYLFVSIVTIIILSTFDDVNIKRLAFVGFIVSIVLLVAVLFIGEEAKGSKRWLTIFGFSMQPSEFLKPFYAVLVGFILSEYHNKRNRSAFLICFIIHLGIIGLLLLQPDFGMTVTVTMVTAGQLFVAGLPILWIVFGGIIFISGAFASYMLLPHVAMRINSFLDSENNVNYQVEKSLESYIQGGFFGKGPGEGTVKLVLPDAHTDFIFAVAGEELGALFCILIIVLIASIIVRGLVRLSNSKNLFHIYAVVGILMYFAIQSLFNIGVTLHMFPTKGMTLPFISYGGSSALSFAIAIGMYLGLTKRVQLLNTLPKNNFYIRL